MITRNGLQAMLLGSTRFSIFDYSRKGFRASQFLEEKDYFDYLFSSERLEFRFDLFANFWLPAIEAASRSEAVAHVVYYSHQMPEGWKKKLRELDWPPFIELVAVSSQREAGNHLTGLANRATDTGAVVARYRLDDDDIVGPLFFRNLALHATPENIGKTISLARGIGATYESGRFWKARDYFSPFIAIGHALIQASSHRTLQKTSASDWESPPPGPGPII